MSDKTIYHIICPCGCGKHLRVEYSGYIPEENIDMDANDIWRSIVLEYGLEGSIEFLHNEHDLGEKLRGKHD